MKKLILLFTVISLFFISSVTKAQLIDEKNVTITMDLQPILQLNMTTPDQTEFVFDEISKYYSGIIKYGATVLKVSSSVSWDLYAVGTSTQGTHFWDLQQVYGTHPAGNTVTQIPLSALELHQYPYNLYAGLAGVQSVATPFYDYSLPFIPSTQANLPVAAASLGQNSIWYSTTNTPYTPPALHEKYIQGQAGFAAGTDFGAPGGSYLSAQPPVNTFSAYYFVIDYRIVPGLPAIFPFAATPVTLHAREALVPPLYAQSGVYSMDVKYILLEDQ